MRRSEERLSGGALNAALANELGKLVADFTGRGATRSRALVHHDVVVCVFEDSATRAERNLVAAGKAELVRLQRDALQHAMAPQLIAAVERLTGRRVRTFMSGTDESGGSSIEAFVLEPEAFAFESDGTGEAELWSIDACGTRASLRRDRADAGTLRIGQVRS